MELTEFEKKLINEDTGELTEVGVGIYALAGIELTKKIVKILLGQNDVKNNG